MTYSLLWLLLGSLSVNLLWAKVAYDNQLYKRATKLDFTKGLVFGLILGPVTLIAFIYNITSSRRR